MLKKCAFILKRIHKQISSSSASATLRSLWQKPVIQALHDAVDENAKAETFMGYGPEQGYAFLREALADYYGKLGADIDADEVFVSDGAKSDIANILDIFSKDCHVVIPVRFTLFIWTPTSWMAARSAS